MCVYYIYISVINLLTRATIIYLTHYCCCCYQSLASSRNHAPLSRKHELL